MEGREEKAEGQERRGEERRGEEREDTADMVLDESRGMEVTGGRLSPARCIILKLTSTFDPGSKSGEK